MYDKISLGDTAEDLITGFSGTVVGITQFITGCKRITLQPKVTKTGEVPDTQSFDEPMLKIKEKASNEIKKAIVNQIGETSSKGGPALYKVSKY